MDVPQDRKFIGFDGYKKAMDCLKPGDIVILTTPPAFRWVHFSYAIAKGLNVFMEKPVTVDGPASRKMLKLAEESVGQEAQGRRGVDVPAQPRAAGTASAHPERRDRRRDPDARLPDAWAGRRTLSRSSGRANPSELLWQIKNFHGFLWASGGCFNDFYIHHIDHLCWMKNAWPVKAQALGGRHYKPNPDGAPYVDQNFDTYSVEYTFADGAKMYMDGRCMNGCNDIYSSYVHGSKGMAIAAKPATAARPPASSRARTRSAPTCSGPPKSPRTRPTPIRTNGTT